MITSAIKITSASYSLFDPNINIFMKKIILTSISVWFIYTFSFVFLVILVESVILVNACEDRGLIKIINM